ncbi:group II intron maturase-specific domain-containing protein [Sodalis sp. RH14]|uniref:group II intron maturase-specific domain-containing protein n=1 Tax=Sodalis sp. RH14 TaxID=3394329 RepID=UPI0039B4CCCD
MARLKGKIRSLTTGDCSKALKTVIGGLAPVLRRWISYCRLTKVKGILDEMDGWVRRKLRYCCGGT